MTCVRAPGSSANLGSGFDVLGMALSQHVWVGDDGLGMACGIDDIAAVAHRRAGGTGRISLSFDLIPGRGLGFSAAVRAAAAVLAYVQAGLNLQEARDRSYPLVAELEGHADNAAPSVYGGLQVVTGASTHRLEVGLPGRLLMWVPEIETSTDGSRRALPPLVTRADAVFNLGRVALLVAALYQGDLALLREATEDRLHQPHRLGECGPALDAIRAALANGAAGAWLSGSGPSVAMIVAGEFVDTVTTALPHDGLVLPLELDEVGAVLTERPSN